MIKKALWLGFISLFLLSACQREEYSTSKPYKRAANEVVETHGSLENIKRLDLFVKNANSGKRIRFGLLDLQ